jgi:alanine racemase
MREAVIDLSAIRTNVVALRRTVGDAEVMVVVKADAYGHGAVPVARAAVEAGATWLGVADLDEALALREAGIEVPMLAWLHAPDVQFRDAVAHHIDVGVSSFEQLEAAAAAGATVQLKVDTGLGRSGAVEGEWAELFERAAAHHAAGRIRVRGLWSHLANASDDDDQLQDFRFQNAVDAASAAGLHPELLHLGATTGAVRSPSTRHTLVRLGIAAYGFSPDPALSLTPAMELAGSVVSVKRVPAGQGVSYGFEYRTSAETTLALIPLGYADGVPRHASNRGPVRIGDTTYTVAGRVAMDQFVVDVGDAPVKVGDRAVLFGDPATGAPSATDWADAAGTIDYEIVTRIGPRVPRRYLP